MPYKKYKKSKYSKYRGYAYDGLSMSKKALDIALATKKLINVEFKVKDIVETSIAITTAGVIKNLVSLSQGTTNETREGDQIKVTSLQWKYTISMNASATDSFVRMLIVLDNQANGATVVLADLLDDATVSDNIVSPINLDNKYRFRILYDKMHSFSINGNRNITRRFYKRCQHKIRYGSNAGTVADIQSKNLVCILIGDEATNTPACTFHFRVRYVDN